MAKEISPRIVVDNRVRFGKPVIKGTRVDVVSVLNHLAAGDSVEEVMLRYDLAREDVLAAIAFSARVVTKSSKKIKETFE